MKNIIFISPNFPITYSEFVKELRLAGFNTLCIGDAPYYELTKDLKDYATEYYYCNLNDYEAVKSAVKYYQDRYGKIDYLESNNEYWLRQDAKLRSEFNIEGLKIFDMDNLQKKSSMKNYFKEAGCTTARYILVDDDKKVKDFVKEVGYPVFTKPDIGVGAQGNFKISNDKELTEFLTNKPTDVPYIMEQFVDADIVSFDGMADENSNVIFCDEEHFPPIAAAVKENKDVFYYCAPTVDPKLEKMGRKIVKTFKLSKRFFHIEFFQLKKDDKYLGKKGDYIPLEANLRFPGGYTPDVIDFAKSVSVYKIWAEVLMNNCTTVDMNYEKFYCGCVGLRDGVNYVHNHDEICGIYSKNLCKSGIFPQILSDDLGNTYYMAKFKEKSELDEFAKFVTLRK